MSATPASPRPVVHLDLGTGTTWAEHHDEAWHRRYLGGGALAAWYLLRFADPAGSPLAPGNVLVFASSVVAGADAPGLSRHLVAARSPLTGGAGESTSSSPFGTAFARAGVLALVIHGRAEAPAYVVVRDGRAELRSAAGLWGLETADARERLRELEGSDASVATIGPAGERLVRFASIVNDDRFMSARSGLGAVMGAKQLKAVVAVPGPPLGAARPALADAVIDDFRSHRRENVLNRLQEDWGLAAWLDDQPLGFEWPVVARNFSRSSFGGMALISGRRLTERYVVRERPPPNIEWSRRYLVRSGPWRGDDRYGGLEPNSIGALGPPLALTDLEALLRLAELTFRLGLDAESLGGTLAWAMESAEHGLDDAGVRFGDSAGAVALTEAIARRSGAGERLADGCARAAGDGPAASLAMAVRGKELPPWEPRSRPGLALAYGVGPIGPDYATVEHDWDFSPDGFPHVLAQSRPFGILERTDERDLGPAKVRQTLQLHRWWSGVVESLLFDLCVTAPARYLSPAAIVRLVEGLSGLDVSVHALLAAGERRILMLHELNHRCGLRAEDALLPERFYREPIDAGAYAGWVLDRDAYVAARDLYHAMLGCNADGRPGDAALHAADLSWVVASRSTAEGAEAG